MADTSLFEVARQTHEETERYQQALVDILIQSTTSTAPLTHKEKLKRSHKASHLLDRIASRNQFLDDLYADPNGDKAREFDNLDGSPLADNADPNLNAPSSSSASSPRDAFAEFYSRLDRIKQYHQKYPGALPDAFAVDFDALEAVDGGCSGSAAATEMSAAGLDFVDRMFSGEEMAGRFMDLYLHHEAFLNLKGVKRVSYLRYIDDFDQLAGEQSKVPNEAKRTDSYKQYLADLRSYLSSFLRKTQPLSNVDHLEAAALETFDDDWDAGKVEGWQDQGDSVFGGAGAKGKGKAKSSTGEAAAADGQGIWCEACRRSYAKQTVYDAHLKSPKHQKAAQRLAAAAASDAPDGQERGTPTPTAQGELERIKRQVKAKALARDEILVQALGRELAPVRADTKANVERKAALTDRERQAEAEAAEEELNRMTAATTGGDGVLDGEANGDDDEEGEEKIYNPLRLPLGWDGRPIPYWLYKLHGLGVEFKCEICSDHVYQGRKNFERHFQESRHAFGMRALGLPNTVQFRDVTRIQDALALADKLKRQGKLEAEQDGDAEEVEDEYGNTYSKKTYELLKRQGLL
ncbi:Pre-mRNA-splicing factor sap61 [Thecaphora frezii]